MEAFDTPILYLIFNRPDIVKQTFPSIKKQKPKQLFIASDGPRRTHPEDAEKVQLCRDWVMGEIDWQCQVKTLFREDNLGCGKGPAEAITWFFDQVEMGIVLEDDCLASHSFFPYCQDLLIRYFENENVFGITGLNWQDGKKRGDASYYFSYYPATWGWATWKSRWKYFQFNPTDYKDFVKSRNFVQHMNIPGVRDSIINSFAQMGNDDVWDYQWRYQVFKNKGLICVPQVNLISNIGFEQSATHTKRNSIFARAKMNEITMPLVHTDLIQVCLKADRYMLNRNLPKGKFSALMRKLSKIIIK